MRSARACASSTGLREDEVIARELNRPVASIQKAAKEVFSGERRPGPLTADEVVKLKEYLGKTTPEVIAMILGREVDEVQRKVTELARVHRTGRWSREELAELKRKYGTRSDEDLACIFGRSVESIRRQASQLALAKDKAFLRKAPGSKSTRMPRWGDEEVAMLKELYATRSNLDIARELNRSVKSVVSKAHNLGLKKDPARLREMGRENVGLRYRA